MTALHLDRSTERSLLAAPRSRPKILLAPVTITPCKPLLPSHLKGLLWTDVMYRATRLLTDVTYRASHTVYNPCEQTAGFWEYLDRTLGDVDYSTYSEEDIGNLYVRFRRSGERAPAAAYRPYLHAIEHHGWVHPASARVLELWTEHYASLGLHDPGLTEHRPPGIGLDEMIERITALGMCLDLREHGGPVYLDATWDGLPLRPIVSADGRPNHLACALRDLLPLAPAYDAVILLYDRELDRDYLLVQKVLTRLGTEVGRVALGRVPINGRISSSREGGWQGHTIGAILDALSSRFDEPVLRLGMRLYFIATLGPGAHQSFRADLLVRCLRRAARTLAHAAGATGEAGAGAVHAFLERHRDARGYVDSYRLASGLLGSRADVPPREVLSAVFT